MKSLKTSLFLVTAVGISAFSALGQITVPTPAAMSECEPGECINQLKFNGLQTEAHWANGAIGNFTIQKYDGQSITMQRTDSVGPSAGLTAVYTGTRKGNDLVGTMTWTWPGHGSLSAGSVNWIATPWATADPVLVTGAVASKLEKSRWLLSTLGAVHYMTGKFRLQFTALPGGGVADIKTVSSSGAPALLDLSRDCLSHWIYNPYLVNGSPTAMRVDILFNFTAEGGHHVEISYP